MQEDSRGDQQRETRRVLEKAAYSRNATERDRAALAAFDEAQASTEQQPHLASEAPDALLQRSRGLVSKLTSSSRPALVSGIAVGALLAAAVAVLIARPWAADPFDRFTNADAFAPDLAQVLAGGYQLEQNRGAAVVAGPVLLHEDEGVRVAAFMDARFSDGQQNVCLMVSERSNGASLNDWSCTPRSDFIRQGLTTVINPSRFFDADSEGIVELQTLTWGADDLLTVDTRASSQ